MTFTVTAGPLPTLPELVALYDSVRWSAYTREPERLQEALENSGFLWTARREDGELIGLIRGLTDRVSILYVQDILVRPEWQRGGVGRALMERMLAEYGHIRQMVLLTDDEPKQLAFYASLGFQNTRELVKTPVNAFYRHVPGPLE